MDLPRIHFLVPVPPRATREMPTAIESYWDWISSQPQIESWGSFSWTLQTYLQLSRGGVACELVHELPDSGVVIAHRDFLPSDSPPGRELYLACILADREQAEFMGHHPWAQFHIVQNPEDRKLARPDPDWPAAFVPYWPQPSLIPRDASRGERFERIAFMGYPHNLARELRSLEWQESLQQLGLTWELPDRSQWHDYAGVDAIVAVRSFNEHRRFEYKPASKLHNAWRAGVPAILGPESAYRAWRRAELDYIEVRTFDEAVTSLRLLRGSPVLRAAMVRNGRERAGEVSVEQIIKRWRELLSTLADQWRSWRALSDADRAAFLGRRAIHQNG